MTMMNVALGRWHCVLQHAPSVVVTVECYYIAAGVGVVALFDGYHRKSSAHDDDVPVVDFAGVGIGRAKVHCRK